MAADAACVRWLQVQAQYMPFLAKNTSCTSGISMLMHDCYVQFFLPSTSALAKLDHYSALSVTLWPCRS
jgi:hypothetical protein